MTLQPDLRAPILALILAIGVGLSGCQSAPKVSSSSSMALPKDAPKDLVIQALKSQRKQSFSYHSNVEIAAPTVNSPPKAVASSAHTHCQTVHDNAYINLIRQAEAAKADVYDERFEMPRNQIKANYVTCFDAYQAWLKAQESDNPQPADKKYAALIKMFDNYPVKQSKSDFKNRQLLNEYGLKPLSINAQGNYQPILGKMTLLASVQYHAKNHQSQINQPIYADLKSGQLYLWADNAAFITSQLLDEKLGVNWKNKWLRIDLNDGSLPKGFGKALIQNHFTALDTMLNAMPASEFNYIAPTDLSKLNFTLPSHQLSVMKSSVFVVRQQQSLNTQNQNHKTYLETFYNLMSKQFPELVIDESDDPAQVLDPEDSVFDSKKLMQLMLRSVKTMATSENVIAKAGDIEERFYGFDNRKRLVWQQTHSSGSLQISELPNQENSIIVVDGLNQFLPLNRNANFVNLPKDSQVPTVDNSVDLKDYSKALLARYKEGGGAMFGKMIFGTISGQSEMFPSDEPEDGDILEDKPIDNDVLE